MDTYRFGRFEVERRSELAKTAVGALVLVRAASVVLSAVGKNPRWRGPSTRAWASMVRRFLSMEVRVEGRVPAGGPYIVAPLHEGFADALVLLSLGLDLRFLARDELYDWPELGHYLRATNQIRVPTKLNRAALRALHAEVGVALASGESVVVFPQGSLLGLEVAFADGAFRLAERYGVPVLPVVLTGSHRVWEHPFSDRLRYGCQVAATILPPVPAQVARGASRRIERQMKQRAQEPGRPPARRYDPERDGYWDGYAFEIDPAFPDVANKVMAHRTAGTPTPD